MKIIIAGGRDFDDYKRMCEVLQGVYDRHHTELDFEVISGMARGADMLGYRWAKEHGIKVSEFHADWAKYGRSAGYKRNELMANWGDCLVAFWDGKSRGTMHMINIMRKEGKPVHIITYPLPTSLPTIEVPPQTESF